MKVTIDGMARTMTILAGVTQINVMEDLYGYWKEWNLLTESKYLQAFKVIGGFEVEEGQKAPTYYFLMNDWVIIADTGEDISISTNLYTLNADKVICLRANNTEVTINNSSAVTVSSDDMIELLQAIKNKTDQLNFISGDVVSTLDGEKVSIDDDSAKRSKAKATIAL